MELFKINSTDLRNFFLTHMLFEFMFLNSRSCLFTIRLWLLNYESTNK